MVGFTDTTIILYLKEVQNLKSETFAEITTLSSSKSVTEEACFISAATVWSQLENSV